MILVDLSQTIIAVAFQNFKGEYSKDLIRAMVFQTLISYRKKFGSQFGDMVLAIDSPGTKNWRKLKYPWYKARRENKLKDPKDKLKWERIFECTNQLLEECKENLTWKTVGFPGAEADDVIAVITSIVGDHEATLIISSDKDFPQLQKYSKVRQYSATQKKYIDVDDPIKYLHDKILHGDNGDDIPNILSANNSFTDKIKQKSITEKISSEWNNSPSEMMSKYKVRYEENKELIDLSMIPENIKDGVIQAYADAPVNGIQKLYKFFVSVRMTRILEDINLFKVNSNAYELQHGVCADDDFFNGGDF